MPRLSTDEWVRLGRASEKLVQVAGALQQTNWAGSPLAQALIRDAYEIVAEIYNRAEPFAMRFKRLQGRAGVFASSPAAPGNKEPGEG